MKLIAAFLAVTLSLFSLTSCTSSHSVADKVRSSVIRVTNGSEDISVCTGFVVSPSVVVTAQHCVGPLQLGDGYSANVIYIDQYYDLAALSIPKTSKPPLQLTTESVYEGQRLIGIGYGFGWTYALSLDVRVANPLQKPTTVSPSGVIVQGTYAHGMSGGPVVDTNGDVVGIIQSTSNGLSFGVNSITIIAFLQDAGITINN